MCMGTDRPDLRSRAFVRAAADHETLPVPSQTFLLQNIYDELEGARV